MSAACTHECLLATQLRTFTAGSRVPNPILHSSPAISEATRFRLGVVMRNSLQRCEPPRESAVEFHHAVYPHELRL